MYRGLRDTGLAAAKDLLRPIAGRSGLWQPEGGSGLRPRFNRRDAGPAQKSLHKRLFKFDGARHTHGLSLTGKDLWLLHTGCSSGTPGGGATGIEDGTTTLVGLPGVAVDGEARSPG